MRSAALMWVVVVAAGCGVSSDSGPSAETASTTTTTVTPSTVPAPPATDALGMPVSPAALPSPAAPSAGPVAPLPTEAGERALALQVALDRAHFSPGEIDGVAGSNQERAIRAFARARAIEPTEEAVWAALDGAPATVDYAITVTDVAGPFVKVPADMMAKAKLDALGYESAAEALGEKFHASPALLRRLNPERTFAAGEVIRVPNVRPAAPEGRATRVVVDQSDFSVTAYGDGETVLASYPATMGSEKDPLPVGDWTVNGVSRDPVFNYNPDLFWDAKAAHAKAKIPPGPNNPVGVVWIDLSKEHYGIHGTPAPSRIGKTESHGCIRLTNWDARELADLVAPGLPARLQE